MRVWGAIACLLALGLVAFSEDIAPAVHTEKGILPIRPTLESTTYTKHGYIADGLIGMWDAMDPSESTFELRKSSGGTYEITGGWLRNMSNAYVQFITSSSIVPDIREAYQAGEITLELVVDWTTDKSSSAFWRHGGYSASTQVLAAHVLWRNNVMQLWVRDYPSRPDAAMNFNTPPFKRPSYVANILSLSAGRLVAYCNTTRMTLSTSASDLSSVNITSVATALYLQGDGLGCARYYSRALSRDEIRHNYEIDKRRFGL